MLRTGNFARLPVPLVALQTVEKNNLAFRVGPCFRSAEEQFGFHIRDSFDHSMLTTSCNVMTCGRVTGGVIATARGLGS